MVSRVTEPLSKEEMDKIILASSNNDFYYLFLMTAKTTGRRIGELYGVEERIKIGKKKCGVKTVYDINGNKIVVPRTIPVYSNTGKWTYGLKIKDIDLNRKVMKIWVLKRRRYIQDETILTDEVCRLMSQYILKNKLNPEDYLFRKYHYRTLQYKIKSYAKKAGITKRVSIHSLRHYFITELLKQGWHHNQIVKLTGHKSIGTLMTYDHVISEDLRKMAEIAIRNL